MCKFYTASSQIAELVLLCPKYGKQLLELIDSYSVFDNKRNMLIHLKQTPSEEDIQTIMYNFCSEYNELYKYVKEEPSDTDSQLDNNLDEEKKEEMDIDQETPKNDELPILESSYHWLKYTKASIYDVNYVSNNRNKNNNKKIKFLLRNAHYDERNSTVCTVINKLLLKAGCNDKLTNDNIKRWMKWNKSFTSQYKLRIFEITTQTEEQANILQKFDQIRVGFYQCELEIFIPNKNKSNSFKLCHKCFNFKHSYKSCPLPYPRCKYCSKTNHKSRNCRYRYIPYKYYCFRCHGNHSLVDASCPILKNLETKHNIKIQARYKRVTIKASPLTHNNNNNNNMSYKAIVKPNSNNNNNNNNLSQQQQNNFVSVHPPTQPMISPSNNQQQVDNNSSIPNPSQENQTLLNTQKINILNNKMTKLESTLEKQTNMINNLIQTITNLTQKLSPPPINNNNNQNNRNTNSPNNRTNNIPIALPPNNINLAPYDNNIFSSIMNPSFIPYINPRNLLNQRLNTTLNANTITSFQHPINNNNNSNNINNINNNSQQLSI